MRTIVRCGTLIPGDGRGPVERCALLLEEDRIAAVSDPGKGDEFAAKERHDALIDAGDLTVLPGLIDSHDHLGLDIGDEDAQMNQSDAAIAIRGVRNARYILGCGVTLIRDLGEKNHIDFALREAIDAGTIPGPSLLCSGMAITRTGGHGHMGLVADGPDEVRRAVRQQLKAGADIVKIMITGGISTRGSSPLTADYTMEEIKVAADEAQSRGKTTSAHAYGGIGAQNAIRAGITSLEHGSFLSKDELALMAEHGTFLVTTMGGIIGSARGKFEVPAFMLPKLQRAAEVYLETVRNARAAGVQVTPGTDENHGQLVTELEYLMECGWSEMEAVCSTTSLAAKLCDLDKELGSVSAGKYADLVAVRGAPLKNIRDLGQVVKVVKRGRLVVDAGQVLQS